MTVQIQNIVRASFVVLGALAAPALVHAAGPDDHDHSHDAHTHSEKHETAGHSADLNTQLYQRDERGIAPGHFLDVPLNQAPRSTIVDGIPAVATPAGLGTVYEVLDCTREGYITEGEVTEHGGPLFRNIDANKDLKLSRQEFVTKYHARWAPIRHAYFDDADVGGDGYLNINEYMAHLEKLVRLADTNKDGDTAWSEILALRGDKQ